MKIRQTILLGLAVASVTGYWFVQNRQDTILSASQRFGQAVVNDNPGTIWSFMPEEERSFYGFDEGRFTAFWQDMVAPNLKSFDHFEVSGANISGITLSFSSSKKGKETDRFSLFVSGQLGNYYAPYMIANTVFGIARVDVGSVGTEKFTRYEVVKKWICENQSKLEAHGISKMRRGPAFPASESLAQVESSLDNAVMHLKGSVKVASR